MNTLAAIVQVTPRSYIPHSLHAVARNFRETNCYVDLWIEILHACGLQPLACLGCTLASDFEGDHWTFFKPSHGDLDRLYGIRVEEMTLWQPLVQHCMTQVQRGRMPLVEVDAVFLPDTEGINYRVSHAKTTIGIVHMDADAKRMIYFHNAGLFSLSDGDFDGVFGLTREARDGWLPPFAEIVKFDGVRARDATTLRALSLELARQHLSRRPSSNPMLAYGHAFASHVELLMCQGAAYDGYTFAVVRQLGASAEITADYLRWLSDSNDSISMAAHCFQSISDSAKALVLKLARVVNSRRAPDLRATFDDMATRWDEGMARVEQAFAG